jgi:type I restriction enzyme S subunit
MKKFIFENLLQTWFKETSKDWSIRTNRSMFRISTKIVGDNWTDFTLLSMGKPGVTVRDMESGKGKFPESFDTYQIVEPNDLIFCLYDMNETPRTVGYSELNGMITPSYTIVKCYEDINPKFL